MKPVMQTIFYGDPKGRVGNCVQAAVASLLELPLGNVPHFFEDCDGSPEKTIEAWNRFDAWFADFGIYPQEANAQPHTAPGYPHLASGMSPRGVDHQFICNGFDIVHDPHPEGGQTKVDRRIELVVVDPVRLHRLQSLRRVDAVTFKMLGLPNAACGCAAGEMLADEPDVYTMDDGEAVKDE